MGRVKALDHQRSINLRRYRDCMRRGAVLLDHLLGTDHHPRKEWCVKWDRLVAEADACVAAGVISRLQWRR